MLLFLRNRLVTSIFVTNQLQVMRRDVFQAIADPVRRDIIQLLAEGPLSVNTVAENFNVSRPAVSKHLKILNECGVVDFEKRGRERFCKIQAQQLIPAFMWIDQYRKLWEDRIDSFEAYVNQLSTKQTESKTRIKKLKTKNYLNE